jgi:hypothetical protein
MGSGALALFFQHSSRIEDLVLVSKVGSGAWHPGPGALYLDYSLSPYLATSHPPHYGEVWKGLTVIGL